MTSLNPKHKPLHRHRNILNANRNAEHFPQLAEYLFDPVHARSHFYSPQDPVWQNGGWQAMQRANMPPQPTMHQFYTSRRANLQPIPFATEEDRFAYREHRLTAGFVPFVANGNNQFKRMMQLGLDPRKPPTEEELRRREENEAKVQEFRDKMTLETIMEYSGGGKRWRKDAPLPFGDEALAKQMRTKAVADKEETEAEAEAEANKAAESE